MNWTIDTEHFWLQDCLNIRGSKLGGPDRHWCADWDEMPVSAATPEYDTCVCFRKTRWGRIYNWFFMLYFNHRSGS